MMFPQRFHRLLLLLLLLGLVASTAQEQQQQQDECVVGSNGEQVCPQQHAATKNSEEEDAERVVSVQQPTLDQLVDSDNNHQQDDCVDNHNDCAMWASKGECQVSSCTGLKLHSTTHVLNSCRRRVRWLIDKDEMMEYSLTFFSLFRLFSQNK